MKVLCLDATGTKGQLQTGGIYEVRDTVYDMYRVALPTGILSKPWRSDRFKLVEEPTLHSPPEYLAELLKEKPLYLFDTSKVQHEATQNQTNRQSTDSTPDQ